MCKSLDQRTAALFQKLHEAQRVQFTDLGQLIFHIRDLPEDVAQNAKSIIQGLWERMVKLGDQEVDITVGKYHSEFSADLVETRVYDGEETITFRPNFETTPDKRFPNRKNVSVSNCSAHVGRRTPAASADSDALDAVLAAA